MISCRLRPLLVPLAAWIVATTLASPVHASGFQLREQSPSAQGTSFAGVSAGGSDIGGMYFNPAGMALFDGSEVVAGFSLVMPKARLEDAQAARITPTPISGPNTVPNAAKRAVLPALCAMWSLSPELRLGLSVNAPFGMGTDYDNDFVGRYHALKSDLKVIDIAPNVAYRINPQWSLGAAFVARKAEAELTNAVDFLLLGSGSWGSYDGIAKLKGDKWGYGYRLGLLFQPMETIRIGLAHHSAMNMTLSGDATYQFAPGTTEAQITAIKAAGFVDGGASAELRLPSTTSFGIHAQVSPALSLQGELARTGWSTFKELRVDFDNSLPDSVTEEEWRDTWFCSLGLTWKATEAWTFRTGVAYDQGAVKKEYRTPRIPDGNRTWLSLGVGYAFSQSTSVDFTYTHILVSDGPLDLKAVGYNRYRGDLSGNYKSSITILAGQARFVF